MDDMHTTPEDITVDFTFLDETFQDDPDRLLNLLEMIHTELESSEDLMMDALRTRNELAYRDIKHKLLPSLTYLKIPGMKDVLEEAKAGLMEHPDTFDSERYAQAIGRYYAGMKQAVLRRIAAMKGH
jgi:hypothetical protein